MIANLLYRILFSGSGAEDNAGEGVISSISVNAYYDSGLSDSVGANSAIEDDLGGFSPIVDLHGALSGIESNLGANSEVIYLSGRFSGFGNDYFGVNSAMSTSSYASSRIDNSGVSASSNIRPSKGISSHMRLTFGIISDIKRDKGIQSNVGTKGAGILSNMS